MYNIKNSGPKIEPCGMPHLIIFFDERYPFIWHF